MFLDKNIFFNIAGFIIQIRLKETEDLFLQEKLYFDIQKYYSGFIIIRPSKSPDYIIEFIKKKKYATIIKEENIYLNFFSDNKKNKITCMYDVGLMHFQLLVREALQRLLAKHHGFLLHASANLYGGKAIFFPAKQGSGKSTVMSLLHEQYPALADDTVIVKKEGKSFYFYQTPFVETNHWVKKTSKRYPIGMVFFLRKSQQYTIRKTTDVAYSIDRLAKQLRSYKEFGIFQVKYLLEFVEKTSCYFLQFGKDKTKLLQLFQNSQL